MKTGWILAKNGEIKKRQKVTKIGIFVEKNKFSGNKISKEEEKLASDIINEISYNIYMDIRWYKKLMYKFIKFGFQLGIYIEITLNGSDRPFEH